MRTNLRRVVVASSIALAAVCMAATGGFAQTKPAQAAADEAPPPVEQVVLTAKQIEGVLGAQKDVAAVMAKVPEGEAAPDPKVLAQLDGIAKKHGFADYAEYDKVVSNIGLVLSGFDPETKKFVGPDVMLKKQIAQIKADKQMPAKDKTAALDELTASLKEFAPIKFPENIKLVGQYYDKLNAAFQQE